MSSPPLTCGSLVQRYGQAALFFYAKTSLETEDPLTSAAGWVSLKSLVHYDVLSSDKVRTSCVIFLSKGPRYSSLTGQSACSIFVHLPIRPSMQKLTTKGPERVTELEKTNASFPPFRHVSYLKIILTPPPKPISSFQVDLYILDVFLYVP